MDIAINAWFWNQPATGSGQYIRSLVPVMAQLAPQHVFHLVFPAGISVSHLPANVRPLALPCPGFLRRQNGWYRALPGWHRVVDFYKLWFEQVAFPRALPSNRSIVQFVPYFASPARSAHPTIVTIHDLIPILLPAYRGSAPVRAYMHLVASAARRATKIITDSACSRKDIVTHLGIPADRVAVIYLAAGPHYRPASAAEIKTVRARYGLPEQYVLYLGGFDVRKNVGTLLKAWAQMRQRPHLRDVKLVLAGQWPTHDTRFTPAPQRIAAQLKIEEEVLYTGWVAEKDKPALYSGAQIFVFPSRYEGFGLPVLEAMACGTPVITANTSSFPEVVGSAGPLLDPDDPAQWATEMADLLTDTERRQALRQAALAQAGRFSWHHTAQATLDLLVTEPVQLRI